MADNASVKRCDATNVGVAESYDVTEDELQVLLVHWTKEYVSFDISFTLHGVGISGSDHYLRMKMLDRIKLIESIMGEDKVEIAWDKAWQDERERLGADLGTILFDGGQEHIEQLHCTVNSELDQEQRDRKFHQIADQVRKGLPQEAPVVDQDKVRADGTA